MKNQQITAEAVHKITPTKPEIKTVLADHIVPVKQNNEKEFKYTMKQKIPMKFKNSLFGYSQMAVDAYARKMQEQLAVKDAEIERLNQKIQNLERAMSDLDVHLSKCKETQKMAMYILSSVEKNETRS